MCGLDPRHGALTGAEMRACWTPPDALLEDDEPVHRTSVGAVPADPGARLPRTFVPVDELVPAAPVPHAPSKEATSAAPPAAVDTFSRTGWSLWGEPER